MADAPGKGPWADPHSIPREEPASPEPAMPGLRPSPGNTCPTGSGALVAILQIAKMAGGDAQWPACQARPPGLLRTTREVPRDSTAPQRSPGEEGQPSRHTPRREAETGRNTTGPSASCRIDSEVDRSAAAEARPVRGSASRSRRRHSAVARAGGGTPSSSPGGAVFARARRTPA